MPQTIVECSLTIVRSVGGFLSRKLSQNSNPGTPRGPKIKISNTNVFYIYLYVFSYFLGFFGIFLIFLGFFPFLPLFSPFPGKKIIFLQKKNHQN